MNDVEIDQSNIWRTCCGLMNDQAPKVITIYIYIIIYKCVYIYIYTHAM